MLPAEALAIWAEACESVGFSWYLYKDTLLCANGYHTFPETLSCAQIAVCSEDLSKMMDQVFPNLPVDWTLDKHLFSVKKNALCIRHGDAIVLEIYILHPLENAEQAEAFSATMRQIRANARTKIRLLDIFNRMLGQIFDGPIQNISRRIDQKAFDSLLSLVADHQPDAPCYCDHLTSKPGAILEKELLSTTDTILCDGVAYPVFSAYRTYLADVYGDYENGLFDEIGCGLTVEDKAALKNHQVRCKEALAFIQQLGEEFSLRYYLLAGSVLGPVRHGGFIPWDDDIDIGIRIEDLARFEELVKEYLPSRLPAGFELMQSGPNNPYPRMFSKICFEGRCCIDLWPLVPTYTDGLRAKLTWYFAKIITKVHYKKIGHRITRFVKLVNLMSLFMSDRFVMWLARLNERKFKNRNTDAYINLYSVYRRNKETILREWLDTEATLDFDGIRVPVVGCTEAYLTHLYGDYMAQPAPWKRASRHVARFGVEEETLVKN